ncbi:MAG: serine/threonine protein kinase, partial [Planctomycetaceae bacterium]|nr:serine/threonine protein kinase [Planctomycetaceae bacterium]
MALRRNMAEVSPKSFLNLLQKSGLCDSDELKATVSELFEKADGRPINLQQLTDHLVESDFISPWHVKKLTAGKYKGFFLGKYKLWQHLGTGGMSTVYLARHTLFKQMRAIKVLPRNRVEDKTFLQRFYREGRAA